MSLPGMGTSSVPVRQVMLVPRARRRGRPPFPEEVAASAGARSAKISVPSVSRITLFVGAPASSYVTALHRKPLFVTELSSKPASTLSSPPGLGPRDAPHSLCALRVAPLAALHAHLARELGPRRPRRARQGRHPAAHAAANGPA